MDRRDRVGALVDRIFYAAPAFDPAAIIVIGRASGLHDKCATLWVIIEFRTIFPATLFWAGLGKSFPTININHAPHFPTNLGGAFIVRRADQASIRVIQLNFDALACFDAFGFRVSAKAF